MGIVRRLQRVRDHRRARLEGLGAGVGLLVPDERHGVEGLDCPVCGNRSRPVLIDIPARRSVLHCDACDREWQSVHTRVRGVPGARV